MRRLAQILAKVATLWLVLVIAQMIGGMLIYRGSPAFEDSGPLGGGQALLASNAVNAAVLAALALSMRLRGFKLGLTLGVVFFAVECGLSAIEVVVYGSDLPLSPADLAKFVALELFHSLLAGLVIALLWRRETRGEARGISGLAWKIPAVVFLYVLCYSVAGYEIAWRSEAVRTFYAHIAEYWSVGKLLAVQCGRGLIWCGLAWMVARNATGPAWRTALLTGLTFSLVMAVPLLGPSPIMPWPVRAAHFVEIMSSNLIFGIGAVLILLGGVSGKALVARPA